MEGEPRNITVKLLGDGANIAASATMVFLTFSFPRLTKNVFSAAGRTSLSVSGNHTFVCVKGPEDYDFLKACFEPVWKEVGDLIKDPHVYIGGQEYRFNIVFGSDYIQGLYK